jgi:hypothetical protein
LVGEDRCEVYFTGVDLAGAPFGRDTRVAVN